MSYLGKRKVREGLVVSDKMDKTVVVVVETKKVHPLYKKASRVTKKYKAHDENNACKIGDKVKIIETRPLSNDKNWRVTEIISKKKMVETRPKKPRKKK
jgi:small subunit ribosomal protein S17